MPDLATRRAVAMRHYVTVTTPSRTVRYSHVHVPIAEPPINGGQGWYFADFAAIRLVGDTEARLPLVQRLSEKAPRSSRTSRGRGSRAGS